MKIGIILRCHKRKLDFQVENQPWAVFVPIYQYPSQKMSAGGEGGGNPDNLSEIPLTRTMSQLEHFFLQGGRGVPGQWF